MMNLTWFETLNKPALNPPSWIFTPVWTILYIMIAISFFIFLRNSKGKEKKGALFLFITQLLLNFSWSWIFFGMENIRLAMIVILLMWIFILATIISFYKYSKAAARLLIPYFLWVSFAIYLNFNFLILNP